MDNSKAAAVAATRLILSVRGIDPSRVTIDKFGNVVAEGHEIARHDRNLIGVLKHIILDLAGDHVEQDMTQKLYDTKAHHQYARYIVDALGGAIGFSLGLYYEAQEELNRES